MIGWLVVLFLLFSSFEIADQFLLLFYSRSNLFLFSSYCTFSIYICCFFLNYSASFYCLFIFQLFIFYNFYTILKCCSTTFSLGLFDLELFKFEMNDFSMLFKQLLFFQKIGELYLFTSISYESIFFNRSMSYNFL